MWINTKNFKAFGDEIPLGPDGTLPSGAWDWLTFLYFDQIAGKLPEQRQRAAAYLLRMMDTKTTITACQTALYRKYRGDQQCMTEQERKFNSLPLCIGEWTPEQFEELLPLIESLSAEVTTEKKAN
jgi:hypothetical protein